VISALRGQRVNQLHQCAVEQQLIIDGQCEAWQTTEIKRFRNRFSRLETLLRPIARMLYSEIAWLFWTLLTGACAILLRLNPGSNAFRPKGKIFWVGNFAYCESKFTQIYRM